MTTVDSFAGSVHPTGVPAARVVPPPTAAAAGTLYLHQERLLADVSGMWARGHRSVLGVSPTGSGKGHIAAEAIRRAVARGKRALFVVHRGEIVRDVAARLAARGVPCNIAMADESVDGGHATTLGTVQTLAAREWGENVDLVVVDEAHHAVASTYQALLGRVASAHVLGLTATPQRGDGTALGDVFESMVVGPSTRELIERGWLVPYSVLRPSKKIRGVAMTAADAVREYCQRRPTIVFAASVGHGQRTVGALSDLNAALVTGKTPDAERKRALMAFQAGEIDVLVNVQVLTEGTDLPRTSAIVVGRGVSHDGAWMQMLGRGGRLHPGKTDCLVVDLAGNFHDYGLPDDERAWSLDGRPMRAADRGLALRTCAACWRCFRASEFTDATCPSCGAVCKGREDPKVRAERLGAYAAAQGADERRAYLEKMRALAASKKYRRGWADYMYKVKYGAMPWADARLGGGA